MVRPRSVSTSGQSYPGLSIHQRGRCNRLSVGSRRTMADGFESTFRVMARWAHRKSERESTTHVRFYWIQKRARELLVNEIVVMNEVQLQTEEW